jgi:hypothetical protein
MAFLCENCTFYYAPLKDYIEFRNDAIARELYDLCAYQDIDAIAIDSVGRIFLLRDTAIGLVEEDGFKWMTR